jgi:hypothetical protein
VYAFKVLREKVRLVCDSFADNAMLKLVLGVTRGATALERVQVPLVAASALY